MNVGIVVPWQDRGVAGRAEAKDFVVRYLESLDIGKVYIGTYPVDDKPFNLSRCRNEGARMALADGADVLVFTDADTVIGKESYVEAIDESRKHDGVVLIGDSLIYLTRASTESLIEGSFSEDGGVVARQPTSGGWCAMSAATYHLVGGWDERYEGYAPEDVDFYWAANIWVAPTRLVPGKVTNLWHGHPLYGEEVFGNSGPVSMPGTVENAAFTAGHQLLASKQSTITTLDEWRSQSARRNRIPKIIHQFWIGPNPPTQMMKTWEDAHPDWEYIFWDEAELARRYPNGMRCQRQYDYMPELNGKCDIARWEILADYGGVFLDADSECVNALDDWLLDAGFFAAYVNETYAPGMVAMSALGSLPHHPLVEEAVNGISKMTDDEVWLGPGVYSGQSAWQTVANGYIASLLQRVQSDDIVIHPSHLFLPDYYGRKVYNGNDKIYARHYWGSTPNSGFDY